MDDRISKMMEQLQGIQDQVARVQSELATMHVTGEAGGGVVRATANGRQEIISVKIDKEVIDPTDQEMLEDLVVAAVNRALDRSREMAEQRMGEVSRNAFPGLPGFPPFGL